MTASLGALLRGAIDYAGLFPPAHLELAAALANYRVYQRSADAWALGRFVVPVGRLAELEGLLQRTQTEAAGAIAAHRVPLSVLLGSGDAAEIVIVEGFNRRSLAHGAKVESVELKVGSADQARAVLAELPADWQRYIEVPLGPDAEAVLDAVRNGGGLAKARTGGITAEAIPSPEELIGFLARVAARKLAFKATAGLHHPLRGDYRLSYAEGAPSATLYGYLNLLLAAAILWKGGGTDRAMEALLEAAPEALRFDAVSLVWRNLRLDPAALAGMRRDFFHSFGSCSFREPLDELAAGGWT